MRRSDLYKLPRSDDLCTLPECRKVSLIARYQIVCSASFGTFKEDVVIRIAAYVESAFRNNKVAVVFNQLHGLQANALWN